MKNDIESILLTEQQLDETISRIAAQIEQDYADKKPLFLGILKGSFIFMADLVRKVNLPCELDFMAVSSYGNKSVTTGAVKINKDLSADIEGKDVIMVEDILDSGLTLNYLKQYLGNRKPASISIVTLLGKPARRKAPIKADYAGYEVPDAFVVGYGLDYAEKYRNLPYIGILRPSVYENE